MSSELKRKRETAAEYHVDEVRKILKSRDFSEDTIKVHAKAAATCGDAEGWFLLGHAHHLKGDEHLAKKCYKKGAAEGHPKCIYNLACIYHNDGNIEKAEELYHHGMLVLMDGETTHLA